MITLKKTSHYAYGIPWYYGYAYYDFRLRNTVFYPVPLSYIIRLWHVFVRWFCQATGKPSKRDRYFYAILVDALEANKDMKGTEVREIAGVSIHHGDYWCFMTTVERFL